MRVWTTIIAPQERLGPAIQPLQDNGLNVKATPKNVPNDLKEVARAVRDEFKEQLECSLQRHHAHERRLAKLRFERETLEEQARLKAARWLLRH